MVKIRRLFYGFAIALASCTHPQPPVSEKTPAPQATCTTSYDRKEWKHWVDDDKNCLNTRNDILRRDSLSAAQVVNCKVKSGRWKDFYYGEEGTQPTQFDIDHVVPLKEAHEAGGCHWSKEEKRRFANDPENLVVALRKYNRSKGANNIALWQPKDKSRACAQAKIWSKIKKKYALSQNAEEQRSIQLLKDHGCVL